MTMESGVCQENKRKARNRIVPTTNFNPSQNYRLDCCDDVMDEAASCNGYHLSPQNSGCCSCSTISYPSYGGQGFNIYYSCYFTCVSSIAQCCGYGGSGGRAGRSGRAGRTGRGARTGGRIRRRR